MLDASPLRPGRIAGAQNRAVGMGGGAPLEYTMVLLGLIGLFCLVFGSTFGAQFGILEEHHVVSDSHRSTAEWVATAVQDIPGFGRFRPMFFVFHFGKVWLFGANPLLFHLATVGLGITTAWLFYIAARAVGADVASALAFVLLYSVTGHQAAVWHQAYAPQETLGMFLTAAGVASMVKAASEPRRNRWHTMALVLVALIGLTKESFVLIIPALLLLRLILHSWFGHGRWLTAVRTLKNFVLVGMVIFTIELLIPMVIVLSRPASFSAEAAGLSMSSFDPRVWWQLLTSPFLKELSTYALTAVIVLLIRCSWPARYRSFYGKLAGAVLITAVWVLPQLMLYSRGMSERYLFPAIVGLAAIIGLALSALGRSRSWLVRAAWIASLLALVPVLSRGIADVSEAASKHTADTIATHRAVDYLARQVPADRAIIIAADPATPYGFEATYALPVYLRAAGSLSPSYLWPIPDPAGPADRHSIVAESTIASLGYPLTLTSADVGGIAVVTRPTGVTSLPPWFANTQWRELTFRKSYSALVLSRLTYTVRGHAVHTVLVQGEEAASVPSSQPLVTVAPSLRGGVGINPLLRMPRWGLEQSQAGPRLWLGAGVDGFFTTWIWAIHAQRVQVACEVTAGPARGDLERTVELIFASGTDRKSERQRFERAAVLTFSGELKPGRNQLTFRVVDQATTPTPPPGTVAPLLLALHRITLLSE